MSSLGRIRREIAKLREQATASASRASQYPNDPVGYARNVLGIDTLWDQAEAILKSLYTPPYKVLVAAGHGTGKTHLAALALNHAYDSHDEIAILSTGPDDRQVKDVLWGEVRSQRRKAGLMRGMMPRDSYMYEGERKYARGMTAKSGEGFHGRHLDHMLFIFDEAVAIDPVFWEVVRGMFHPKPGYGWLCIFNPTDTGSQAYQEWQKVDAQGNPAWHHFQLSCLSHPNVIAKHRGEKPPIPGGAVSYEQVDEMVRDWGDKVFPGDETEDDIEWPPESGIWYKAGPVLQTRCLGVWASGYDRIWSESLWNLCTAANSSTASLSPGFDEYPEIGCDTARQGDDYTSIHVRWGPCSVHHESHNGWESDQIADRLLELCEEWADQAWRRFGPGHSKVPIDKILVKLDDDAYGHDVLNRCWKLGVNAQGVSACGRATNGAYPNQRSELWFQIRDRARMGQISLHRLAKSDLNRLHQQLTISEWELDAAGRREVEPKDSIKEKLGRSPDDADSFNLSYFLMSGLTTPVVHEGGPEASSFEVWDPQKRTGQAFPWLRGRD